MILGATLDRLDRLQRSFWFKVVASAVVVLIALGIIGTKLVQFAEMRRESQYTLAEPAPDERAAAPDQAPAQTDPAAARAAEAEAAYRAAQRTADEATLRAVNRMLGAKADPTAMVIGVAAITGIVLAVIWLGLGLTSLAILALVALVAVPMMLWGGPTSRDLGRFIAGVAALGFSFFILMELLRVLFSAPVSVFAIARNVVHEAVRMKVSLVFVVILLLGLGALPGLLDPETPLRYRVQSFLQWGTGGTFWIIALLTLFLSVSTVAFEQRDRVIWQTMTKPVAAWQYLLGKWLGVAGVAAVLLGVSSTGIFLFTRYLQDQPAVGEVLPYIPRAEGQTIVEDRLVLESQILAARKSVKPIIPELNRETAQAEVARRAAALKAQDDSYLFTLAEENRLLSEYAEQARAQYYTIEAGGRETYRFTGLKAAKDRSSPITLRYKIDLGANDPKVLLRVTFAFPNAQPVVQEIPLGQLMTLPISPASIDADGNLDVQVVNGDFYRWREGDPGYMNESTISFPPDGLEVFYSVGSYYANFFRVVVVLWIKLAFLAMIGILAATFLSFAVASLVAFGTFLIAETAGYLFTALEAYSATGDKGELIFHRALIRAIAVPVSSAFQFYAQLKPTAALVDGQLIAWGRVLLAVAVLGGVSFVLYVLAVAIFRRRELAMYSGQ